MILDILKVGANLIDKLFPDPAQAAQAKARLIELEQRGQLKELEAAASIVVAEAKSESWITRNWRPITMLVFVFIIANNYIIAPYLRMFGLPHTMLHIPHDMWVLLKVGLGGYVVSRGAEKAVQAWKK